MLVELSRGNDKPPERKNYFLCKLQSRFRTLEAHGRDRIHR